MTPTQRAAIEQAPGGNADSVAAFKSAGGNAGVGKQLGHPDQGESQTNTGKDSAQESAVGIRLACDVCHKDFDGRRTRMYVDDRYPGFVCGPCVRFRLGGRCGK